MTNIKRLDLYDLVFFCMQIFWKNLLLDVTYNVVFDIMLFIDGYYRDDERLEILNTKTGEKLKENPFIELHDSICDYLKYEK